MFPVSQSYFYNQVLVLFKDKVLPTLTSQQKKVVLAVSFIFSCLAFLTVRYYCFKDKTLNYAKKKPDLSDGKSESAPKVKETIVQEDGTVYEIYEGDFKSGCFKGKIIHSKDHIYEGEFENHKLKEGTISLQDGRIYEGKFKNGELNGPGKIILPNGTIEEEGMFESGQLHGLGKRIYSNGIEEEGLFEYGRCSQPKDFELRLNRQGQRISPDGTVFEGVFENGRLTGQGKLILVDGTVFEGTFKYGKLKGDGKVTLPDGTVFEGKYTRGLSQHFLNGPGTITYPDGTVENYCFSDGMLKDRKEPLSYKKVIQMANHLFAGNPQKDEILKRIEKRLADIDYQQSIASQKEASICFTCGDTLWDCGKFEYTNREKSIIIATTYFLQKLPGVKTSYPG